MPTIRRCCIMGCRSNSRQNPNMQFFQFPKPENPFHKLWKQACYASLSRILPFKKPVVCALHFQPNCIGGRRLTASAVPALRLEVPSNIKDEEHQMMIDDIERSRKCAYINAVVYEWLVRANLNPQLRGSITHGMIKEKADTTKGLIDCESFVADNRWLNRFRETHLADFAQKLATNQLKPLGMSLWINDIVKDLEHLFPPTSAESVYKLENVPEQYMDYMEQYGEYEEDDDPDVSQTNSYVEQQKHSQSGYDSYGHQRKEYEYDEDCYYEDEQVKSRQPSPSQSSAKRMRLNDNDNTVNNGNSIIEDLTDNNQNSNSCHSSSSNKPKVSNTNGVPKDFIKTEKLTDDDDESPHVIQDSTNIESYAQALKCLKPLEDFVLLREDFRAIGLLSQLELIFRKSLYGND